MAELASEYVQLNEHGTWRVVGTRVSLDSVVHLYKEGYSPEGILDEFDTLTLEKIHGVIAFYLRNRSEIEKYLHEKAVQFEELRRKSHAENRELLDRLRAYRAASAQTSR